MGVLILIKRIISGISFICVFLYPTGIGMADESYTLPVVSQDIEIVEQIANVKPEVHEETTSYDNCLTDEDLNLISRVVMAEAEDEPFEGKIYVVDTIFNRVDSKHFPNNVHDVIYQKSQFSSMWNGRYDRCKSNKELNKMIIEEFKNRSNNDIVFFTADHYGQYGRPSFRIANHYFSTYK
jgi:N-acetylmuramoyl-L-alanine amidase